MSLKITAAPNLSGDQTRRMSLRNTSENPIEYQANAVRTGRVTREFPISRLGLVLRGMMTVATATPAISAFGLFNLINRLDIRRDGNQPVISVFGHALKAINRLYWNQPDFERDPAALGSTGAKDFFAFAELPFDLGAYNSLLDATGNNSLDVSVLWNTDADLATSGAFTLSNVELLPIPMVLEGGNNGERGGREAGSLRYLRNNILSESKAVTAAESDFRFDLTPGRGYHGLTLMSFSNGALVDTVVNRVTIERAGNIHLRLDREQIQAMNYRRFQLASQSEFTGVYHVPFVDANHPEHTISIDPTQDMKVICDVANPGTDRVELVQHFLT